MLTRTSRYRLYPTPAQARELERQLSVLCLIYNAALEQRRRAWSDYAVLDAVANKQVARVGRRRRGFASTGQRRRRASEAPHGGVALDSRRVSAPGLQAGTTLADARGNPLQDQTRELQSARRDRTTGPMLAGMSAQVQNHVLVRLDRAFQDFFRRMGTSERSGYPRFKFCARFDSLVFPSHGQSHRLMGAPQAGGRLGRIELRGVGAVKFRAHRPLAGTDLGQAAITRLRSGRWQLALTVRDVDPRPLRPTGRSVGVNRGVRQLIATSDGETYAGLRLHQEAERELGRAQRELSRKERGSKGRDRARRRLARLHERVAARRRQIHHELVHDLLRRYDLVALEDLDTAEMLRGEAEARAGLPKRIQDQAWALLERTFATKAEELGREVVVVDATGISQQCPRCGGESPTRPGKASFRCVQCGLEEDRDVAAAQVVLLRARDEESVRRRFGA